MNFIRLAVPVACFVPAACNEFPSAGDFRDLAIGLYCKLSRRGRRRNPENQHALVSGRVR